MSNYRIVKHEEVDKYKIQEKSIIFFFTLWFDVRYFGSITKEYRNVGSNMYGNLYFDSLEDAMLARELFEKADIKAANIEDLRNKLEKNKWKIIS